MGHTLILLHAPTQVACSAGGPCMQCWLLVILLHAHTQVTHGRKGGKGIKLRWLICLYSVCATPHL